MSEEAQRSRPTSPSRYSKATHLTEFYPYLNGSMGQSLAPALDVGHAHTQQSGAEMHSRKQSLSSYTSFTPSTLDFRSLVTKTDISHTTDAFEEVLAASEKYRQALLQVAEAAGDFGAALERTAKCKGAGTAAEGMLSAGGLFFLVANHQQLLAHSVGEAFEQPVRKEVNKFKTQSSKNDESFKVEIKERVRELKQQEKENAKLSRSKTRNLVAYRSRLLQLTSHIDEIDKLKHEYYQSAFDLVQDTSNKILTQVGSVVRAQVEIYEGIARKGWSGGGLDELIAQCPDPFSPMDDEEDEADDTTERGAFDDFDGPEIESNNTDHTLKLKEPELQTTDQGISFNRSVFATKPILSHQLSIQSFKTTDSISASTPIKMSPKSQKGRDSTLDATVMADNSFSLPVPGSARLKKEDSASDKDAPTEDVLPDPETDGDKTNDDDNDDDNEDEEREEEQETRKEHTLEQFPVHNEWADGSRDTHTEAEGALTDTASF